MTSPVVPERRTLLMVLLALVSVALVAVLIPFYGTLLWAVIIALLFTPVFRRLLRRWPGRRNQAALLTLLAVLLMVVLPFAVITATLINEAAALYARVQASPLTPAAYLRSLYDTLPQWATDTLVRLDMADFDALQTRLTGLIAQGSQLIATQALQIGQNTFEWVASLFIMLYIAFFLIRDGDAVVRTLREAVPLTAQHQHELIDKFTTVIRATVKGNVLVAALQGALGGLAFWYLDVSGALLWAVLMAFLSLLPAVGAALVWAPVALYFLTVGQVAAAIGLVAWGVLVIGLVDNVLRPILVGKDTRLPDYVVLITTLGGLSVFGINGFVLGPVIAAMFVSVWHIVMLGRRAGVAAPPPLVVEVPAAVAATVPAAVAATVPVAAAAVPHPVPVIGVQPQPHTGGVMPVAPAASAAPSSGLPAGSATAPPATPSTATPAQRVP